MPELLTKRLGITLFFKKSGMELFHSGSMISWTLWIIVQQVGTFVSGVIQRGITFSHIQLFHDIESVIILIYN
jgi:hypothetical protein